MALNCILLGIRDELIQDLFGLKPVKFDDIVLLWNLDKSFTWESMGRVFNDRFSNQIR